MSTIYTRFENPVRILENCGVHSIRRNGEALELHLVFIERTEDKRRRFCFAESLRAEHGWSDIEQAIRDALVVKLTPKELKAALKAAQS